MESKFKIVEEELLEDVAGGEFGGSEHTTTVTEANYASFIHSAVNVVVLFGVSWSGTCVRASELMEECAVKYSKVRVGIFEVTDSEFLMYKLGIKNVPTSIRYKHGIEVNRVEGTQRITNLFKMYKNPGV
jgi:thioredoxin-like negative regulator of GroEL